MEIGQLPLQEMHVSPRIADWSAMGISGASNSLTSGCLFVPAHTTCSSLFLHGQPDLHACLTFTRNCERRRSSRSSSLPPSMVVIPPCRWHLGSVNGPLLDPAREQFTVLYGAVELPLPDLARLELQNHTLPVGDNLLPPPLLERALSLIFQADTNLSLHWSSAYPRSTLRSLDP